MGKSSFRQFEVIFKTKTTLTKQKTVSLLNILKGLFLNPISEEFRDPLDWEQRGLVNYGIIIQQPMDLMTVKESLQKEMYFSIQDCLNDIELIFQNSRHYNRGTQWIEELTDKCEKVFLKLVRNYLPEIRPYLEYETKKIIKIRKIEEKHNITHSKEVDKEHKPDNKVHDNAKLEQRDQDTAVTHGNERQANQVNQSEEITQLRTEFFDLIRDSSENSLQIAYLIIKGQDLTVINTERNGNCRIDVKKLSENILIKLIGFLKEQKERETYQHNKQTMAKKKRIDFNEKSRYEI